MIKKQTNNAICVKLKYPIIYNEGTSYETKEDVFLMYYTNMKDKEAQTYAEKLTKEKPEFLLDGTIKALKNIDYYFVNKQIFFED